MGQHAPSPHPADTPGALLPWVPPERVPEAFEPGIGDPVTVLRTLTGLSVEQMVEALWMFGGDPGEAVTAGPAGVRACIDRGILGRGIFAVDIAAMDRADHPPAPGSEEAVWEARARAAVEAMLAAEASGCAA